MDFPTIETDRLVLRQIVNSDLPNIFKGLSDPMVTEYYGVSFSSIEATEEQMDWFRELEEKETGIWWLICLKDTEEFCGAGGLNDLNKVHKKAEIGFWLLPEYWGKGYVTEALSVIMDYGFNQLGLHRIEGFVDSNNEKCQSAVKKLNMNYEGTMRDSEVKGNSYISIDIYSIFQEEEINSNH